MSLDQRQLDELCVNTIRLLSVDQVEAAKSGHPGLPLGAAAPAYVLWTKFLRHNPAHPAWPNRDRFILSAGHGSALLYSLLHLTGYDLPLEELKNFRQWGSRTPGHPEYGLTPGVEATTGPLGQGFAMGVGMALAEAHLAAVFNRPGHPVIDHFTYALVSDGDLMEGVSAEAASLAGHLGLGKLVYIYDDNKMTIEGSTDLTFTEDVAARFAAYGWQVLRVEDGNDLAALEEAIAAARAELSRPSLILARTCLGYGSPRQDTAKAHGEPLGPDNCRLTKENLRFPADRKFHVPPEAAERLGQARAAGSALERSWRALFKAYAQAHPELAARLGDQLAGRLPDGWVEALPAFQTEQGPLATRAASGQCLQALAQRLPQLLGGSADLAPSNNTMIKDSPAISRGSFGGRNIHFGVRELAMTAVTNGLALHGGLIPYCGTFLIFSDYMRPAIRLAALMKTKIVLVLTHDSVGVGEDGPTHQPVEQVMSLRAIPGLTVLRPAEANETALAWRLALERPGPAALILTRQNLPVLSPELVQSGPAKGGYVLADAPHPDLLLLATGSEVHLALAAREALAGEGIRTRVVSLPSWEIFKEQDEAYRRAVLLPGVKKLALEAGVTLGWERWVGEGGAVIGLDRFGASAPGPVVFDKLGFNLAQVVAKAKELLGR